MTPNSISSFVLTPHCECGAILDWQRSIDPNVRQFYSREQAIAGLAQKLGRRPNEFEILEHLAIADHTDRRASSIDEIRRSQAARDRQEFVRDSLRSQSMVGSLNDLSPLLKGLNQTERMIVLLYFVEDCTMKQIGKELGISESRVSQCMTQILPRLRESYERAAA
ncbi:MAG: sigma-70 family RNA polymerase sigma factor [Pirellulales bacterium]